MSTTSIKRKLEDESKKQAFDKRKQLKTENKIGDLRMMSDSTIKRWDGKYWRKTCVECKTRHATCYEITTGYNEEKKGLLKWCLKCAKAHHSEMYIRRTTKKCEDCTLKNPTYGVLQSNGKGKYRWCAKCAHTKHRDEAIRLNFHSKCEDCKKVHMSYGTYDEDGMLHLRWCATCAYTNHYDECVCMTAKCADCKLKQPHYGILENGKKKRLWCVECAKKYHATEYVAFLVMCEQCTQSQASYGMKNANNSITAKWCAPCALNYHADIALPLNRKCIYVEKDKQCASFAASPSDFCKKHDPQHVGSVGRYSKMACACIDQLATELHTAIQHVHLTDKEFSGSEHKIPSTNFSVDGFVSRSLLENPELQNIFTSIGIKLDIQKTWKNGLCIEFLGDYWHGHPLKYDPEATSGSRNCTFRDLYQTSLSRIQKIASLEFGVLIIWESDFTQWIKKKDQFCITYCKHIDISSVGLL